MRGITIRHRLAAAVAIAGFAVSGLVPAYGADEAKLLNVKADSVNDQVVLFLSHPAQMTLTAPLEKDGRYLILDIHQATLSDLAEKNNLLSDLQAQLADVAQVSLDQFQGNESLVRLVIHTKDPNVSAALQDTDTSRVIIQLVKAQPGPVITLTSDNPPPSDESISLRKTGDTKLSGKTQLDVNDPLLKAKTFEAESLRRERNKLEGQVSNLKLLVDQQQAMISHVKETQMQLAARNYTTVQKTQIQSLQQQLTDLQKSYDTLQNLLQTYQAEMATMASQVDKSQLQVTNLSSTLDEKNKVAEPDSAIERGGLLNTLSNLTPPEINKLVSAEKAFRAGKKAEFDRNWKEAEAQYKRATGLAPQVQEYATTLAVLYMNMKNFDKAQQVLETALPYHPDDSALLNEMGKVALLKKDDQTALALFQKALPSGVLSNYASTLRRVNKPDDAETIYKLAIASNPKDSDLPFNLGNLYLADKRFKDAQAQYETAIKMAPDFAEAHFHLGLTYAQEGKSKPAMDELNTYLKLMPNAPNKDAVKDYLKDLAKVAKSG